MAARIATVSGGDWLPGTSEIAKIEREDRSLLSTELLVLAEVLETTPHELFSGTGWSDVVRKLTDANIRKSNSAD